MDDRFSYPVDPQNQFLARLRLVRSSGRIVLQLTPQSSGNEAIPDFSLENGDRFVVPSMPATVNVVGAIYNQNSFRYRRGVDIKSYLKLAGGPNRYADQHHIFIIHADGSVINRDAYSGIWRNSFLHIRLNPGDSIIVPEKNMRPGNTLKTIMDWTQSFSQLSVAAATLSLLK